MTCNKTSYSTERFAIEDIARIKNKSKRQTIPLRAYLCHCGSWHLTHKKDNATVKLEQKIESLIIQNEKFKTEIFNLKKSDNKQLKIDSEIITLKNTIQNKNEIIKKLRIDNKELVYKLMQKQSDNAARNLFFNLNRPMDI
ncbi:MAG: hypothetical protein WCT77_05835 [Bacteroidota bacterium]